MQSPLRDDLARTALISDSLDALGHRAAILPQEIAPIWPGARACGRAMTLVFADVPAGKSSRGLIDACEEFSPASVIVAAGETQPVARWGELLSLAAAARGVVGLVAEGYVRDTAALARMRFPVFALGSSPQRPDARIDVVTQNEAIRISGVSIEPGDLIVADSDGVVAIPRRLEAELIEHLESSALREQELRRRLSNGDRLLDALGLT
jgi:4-hydroxy-4-methyl-2-oxoglutarate aldolase